MNSSKIVTYVYYNDEFHPAPTILENPNKLYLGTHIFKNQPINSVFEVINSSRNVLANTETPVHYRINNIDDEMTVVFVLDDDVEFIGAEVSQGNYHYDSSQNILYWNLSASNGFNDIILNVKPNAKGTYNIRSYVHGTDDEINVTAYATDYGVILTSEKVTTYKTYYKSLEVYLTDGNVPLIGEKVSIMIDGTTYEREVTPKGYAALSIMLQPGEYDAIISYDGQLGKNQTTSKISVKKTILSDDLNVFYGQTYAFNVSFLDENGNAYANGSVDFSVDGVLINKHTDANGTYSLEIYHNISKIPKLKPGNHTITSYNGRTNEYVTNRVIIKEPVCDLSITKTANATSIHISDSVKWTVNVLNNGPCDAHDVLVTDALPSGIKYVSHNASKGFYDEKCGIWTIGNLTIGESITLELYCIALEEGLFTNGVNVTCNETDNDLSNNYANSTIEVNKNVTPLPPSPPTPNLSNTTNSTSAQVAEPAKMLATGNPIAYLIAVIMVIFGSIWIPNRKR